MKPVSDLSFGYNDAREYLAPESKALLGKFFLADTDLDQLSQNQRYYLIGEKGTGKTAYAAFISNFGYGDLSGSLVFLQDVDYSSMLDMRSRENLLPADLVSIWEVILLVLAFARITREGNQYTVINNSFVATAESIFDELSIDKSCTLSDVFEILRNAKEVIELANANLASENSARRYSSSGGIARDIKRLRQIFMSAIGAVQPLKRHILFLDGIDVRSSKTRHQDYLEVVKGLANAVWTLNSERIAQIEPRYLRIVLLTRPDILEGVSLQNLHSKIRDNSVALDWKTTYDYYRSSKLFRLADRVLFTQQDDEFPHYSIGEVWDSYFPFKVFNRRRDTDEPSDHSFIPFLRYSFYRPRDVLTLMDIIHRRTCDTGGGAQKYFSKQCIRDFRVLQEYSAYLLGEVKESLSFYYEVDDYELFLKFFEYLDGHIHQNSREFSYQGFCHAFDELIRYMELNKVEVPVIFETADRFLQFLYQLNIICFFSGERGAPKYARWCFRERSYANIRPKVKAGCTYKVHFGIARALNPSRFG